MHRLPASLLGFVFVSVGCAEAECPTGFEKNADGLCLQVSDTGTGDSDADTDADSDTDTDADSDTDADTDTDTSSSKWTVCDDGAAPFTTLQEAVDAAADGDTITVCSGRYAPVAWSGKALTLSGAGSNTTFIDMAGGVPGLDIQDVDGSNVISGLTVAGSGTADFRAVSLVNARVSLLAMVVSDVVGDDTDQSAAIWISGGAVRIEGVQVTRVQNVTYVLSSRDAAELEVVHSRLYGFEDVYGAVYVDYTDALFNNNAVYDVTQTGPTPITFAENGGVTSWVYNNVFYGVGDSDYSVQVGAGVDFDNNIIVAGTRVGLTNGSTDTEYNLIFGAIDEQWQGDANPTNFSADPRFTAAETADFTLMIDFSPAVDAGNPLKGYNDVNGTRNDLGMFGGPGGGW